MATIEDAKEAFLNLIADAKVWRENVDGDTDSNGRSQVYIDYDINVGHAQLEELANAFGIKRAWDETIKDAIDREVAVPAVPTRPAMLAERPSKSVLAPVLPLAAKAAE